MPAAIASFAGTPASSTSALVANMPSGIVAGDLLVCFSNLYELNTNVATATGWTAFGNSGWTSNAIMAQFVLYKTAAGGDTLTVNTAGTAIQSCGVVRITNHNGVDVSNGANSGATSPTSIDAATVTSTGTGLIVVGLGDNSELIGSTTLTGYTSAGTWDSSAGVIFSKESVAAGSVSPGTMSPSAADSALATMTVAVRDAAAGPYIGYPLLNLRQI
jgi:hypothetical protein